MTLYVHTRTHTHTQSLQDTHSHSNKTHGCSFLSQLLPALKHTHTNKCIHAHNLKAGTWQRDRERHELRNACICTVQTHFFAHLRGLKDSSQHAHTVLACTTQTCNTAPLCTVHTFPRRCHSVSELSYHSPQFLHFSWPTEVLIIIEMAKLSRSSCNSSVLSTKTQRTATVTSPNSRRSFIYQLGNIHTHVYTHCTWHTMG